MSVEVERVPEGVLTVVTKEVLILARAAGNMPIGVGLTRGLASFTELLVLGVVALRDSDVSKTVRHRLAIN